MVRAGRRPKGLDSTIKSYRKYPAKWLYDSFKVELWEMQEEILQSVFNERWTAVKSCYGSGKSFLSGMAVTAFVHLYPNSIALTTAPSYRQLDNIWQPIHKVKENTTAPLGSKLLKHEIRCGPQHFARGFTTNIPSRLQGAHAPHVLIIEDESAGIESDIHERLVDSLMTGADCHFLAIGNPLSPEGHFYDMFTDPKFNSFTISAFDTPNVQEGEEVIPGLVTKEWVEDQRDKYGPDTPMWKSQVLGEFPPSSEEMLIPLTWAKMAQQRWEDTEPSGIPVYGLDPSGGGLDEISLCPRSGQYVFPCRTWQGLSAPELCREILKIVDHDGVIYVDDVGVGYGVKGNLQETDIYTVGVTGQRSPEEDPDDRFRNLRAELYWRLREALDPNNENPLALPPDDKLLAQLTRLKYDIDAKGRIQIESKKRMRSRGEESPNRADSLALTMKSPVSGDDLPIGVDREARDEIDNALYRPSPFDLAFW